jgi:hypothetical protein
MALGSRESVTTQSHVLLDASTHSEVGGGVMITLRSNTLYDLLIIQEGKTRSHCNDGNNRFYTDATKVVVTQGLSFME